jgi:hypothetical protein
MRGFQAEFTGNGISDSSHSAYDSGNDLHKVGQDAATNLFTRENLVDGLLA